MIPAPATARAMDEVMGRGIADITAILTAQHLFNLLGRILVLK
jgi:hypothetical protein